MYIYYVHLLCTLCLCTCYEHVLYAVVTTRPTMCIECTFQVANRTFMKITCVIFKHVRFATWNVHSMFTHVVVPFSLQALFGVPTQSLHFVRPSSVFWKLTLYVQIHVHAEYIFNVSTKNVCNVRTMNLFSHILRVHLLHYLCTFCCVSIRAKGFAHKSWTTKGPLSQHAEKVRLLPFMCASSLVYGALLHHQWCSACAVVNWKHVTLLSRLPVPVTLWQRAHYVQ